MSPPTRLVPIEAHLRAEELADGASVVVRGGPLTGENFLEHARRQMAIYSFEGAPMASVSVFAAVGEWTLERLLAERLWSRTTYATATAGALRALGYPVLATFLTPHYDVVLPEASGDAAATLVGQFSAPQRNPYRRRR